MSDARKKRKGRQSRPLLSRWLRPFESRPAKMLLLLAVVALAAWGGYGLWQRYGRPATRGPEYLLTADKLEVTKQPAWIRSDVKAEVFRDASWREKRLSLLDPELTVKVAGAFRLHSWVAKVQQVSKYPGRVVVHLQYRRPVAMVVVSYNGQSGLYPVDETGVLLPPGDFSESQTRQYPRIVADGSTPSGTVGTPWGDARVAGAARIAALFGRLRHQIELHRIVATRAEPLRPRIEEPTYELWTRAGARILWGHAPGNEAGGEPPAAEKVARLAALVKEHGPLDAAGQPLRLDLGGGRSLPPARTAAASRH